MGSSSGETSNVLGSAPINGNTENVRVLAISAADCNFATVVRARSLECGFGHLVDNSGCASAIS